MIKHRLIIVFLLAILVVINSFFYYSLENFENDNSREKTIFLIWRIKISKNNSQGGLGDKIRGAIAVHQYCRRNNINLIVDGTDDNCGMFLKNIKHPAYNDKIKDNDIHMYINVDYDPEKFYSEMNERLQQNNEVYIFTNVVPLYDIDEHDKAFIKNLIEPSDKLKTDLHVVLKELPDKFGVQHFRFTDAYFSEISEEQTRVFEKCFDLLQQTYKETDVLLTNSNNFKTYVKSRMNIRTIDCEGNCNPGHIGDNLSDYESLKHSFIEFYVMTNANYIRSYTMYDWVSGFADWASKIYDIPLENTFFR
jgi:undecaprenyl pyrophosphate synthase